MNKKYEYYTSEGYEYYTSETNTGGRIRPGNWTDRVAMWTSSFDEHRLKYDDALMPVVCNGKNCLRVNRTKLKHDYPDLYDSVSHIINILDAKLLIL